MSIAGKITNAMADNWMKQSEAMDIVVSAQKGNVSKSELDQVVKLTKDIAANGTKIAAGTKTILNEFVARHDRALDLENDPPSKLKPIFDKVNFWYGRKTASITNIDALPKAVNKGFETKLAADDMTTDEWDFATTEFFKFPVAGKYVFGVMQDDGGNNGGFTILLFSAAGRFLWETFGQND